MKNWQNMPISLDFQRKQRRKIKINQGNNNKQHVVILRNLRQILTSNRQNEHVFYKRIATVNIRSIKNKEDLLRNVINDLKIDNMLVTETWLQNISEDNI